MKENGRNFGLVETGNCCRTLSLRHICVRFALKFLAKCGNDVMRRLNVFDLQPLCNLIDPRCLNIHGIFQSATPCLGQHSQVRSAVMGVRLEFEQTFIHQIVNDALDVLSVTAQVACKPSDRLRLICGSNAAEYFPAGACKTHIGNQAVSVRKQSIVQTEKFQDKIGQGPTAWRVFKLTHTVYGTNLTPLCQYLYNKVAMCHVDILHTN